MMHVESARNEMKSKTGSNSSFLPLFLDNLMVTKNKEINPIVRLNIKRMVAKGILLYVSSAFIFVLLGRESPEFLL
jgi:hypothetical protein